MTTKVRLLFIAIACLISFRLCGQNEVSTQERLDKPLLCSIKYNLTDLVVGRYSTSFEKFLGSNFSFGSEVDFIHKDVFLESLHPWYSSQNAIKIGIIFEPFIRYYLSNHSGLYISINGFFGYATYKLSQPDLLNKPEWTASGGTFQLGILKSILEPFVIDCYLGATYANDDYSVLYNESTALFPAPDGLRLCGGLRVGVLLKKNDNKPY